MQGTTRHVLKVQSLGVLWEKKFGEGIFELATVEDMAEAGAFDEAVKGTGNLNLRREESKVNKIAGVSEVAHVGSNQTFDSDPNKVIPEVLAGVNEILKSAGKKPGVKQFVFTSFSTAITSPIPNKEFIDTDVWSEADIKAA